MARGMGTQITTISEAFPDSKQYSIPSYQRNYVWTRQGQWEPLWEDIKALVARWAHNGQQVEPHFLGTIITKHIDTRRFINRWWVVDGQQRLTTLQVLIAASRTALVDLGLRSFADVLANCLTNSDAVVKVPEDRFKIDLKRGDYQDFTTIVESGPPTEESGDGDSGLSACYHYFYQSFREWLITIPVESRESYANAFSMAVREKLQVVDIRLGESDNPHTIFEALNARGQPLTEWEKTKNYILSIASRPSDPDGDITYRDHLERYDSEPYWNETLRLQRFEGKRVDLFLFYFAQIEIPSRRQGVSGDRRLRPLRRRNLYREFRFVGEHFYRHDHVELIEMLGRLRRYADIYKSIDTQHGFSAYALEVMGRRQVLNLNSLVPVFMELVAKLGTEQELDNVLRIVDSYLMRRVAVKARYSGFDDAAFGHVQALCDSAPGDLGAVLISRFLAATGSERWPRDEEIVQHFVNGNMYNGISGARLKSLMSGIAEKMHAEKRPPPTNQFALEPTVSIEHVAPQSWEKHWQEDLKVGNSEEDRWKLSQIVQRIGNLTLVTHAMNHLLGNKPWEYKAKLLAEDNLEMSRRLIRDMECEIWNQSEIERRSRQLAGYVNKIWPHAETLVEELGLRISVPRHESDSSSKLPDPNLSQRQINAQRYGQFWTQYAKRFPDDGVNAEHRHSNQWIRVGTGNPDISLMFAAGQVGIFFTRGQRALGGMGAWVDQRRAIVDRVIGVGKPPREFQAFNTHDPSNWDEICDWLHDRLSDFLIIVEADTETSAT